MNKRGKAWPFFVVGILIIAFSLTSIFGVSYQYGDTKHTYIKSASDIRLASTSARRRCDVYAGGGHRRHPRADGGGADSH